MTLNKRIIGNVIALFLIFLALGIVIYFVKGEGGRCLENPLVYGAKEAQKANNGHDLLCSCSLQNMVPSPTIIFNSTGMSSGAGRTEGSFKMEDVNVSGYFIKN